MKSTGKAPSWSFFLYFSFFLKNGINLRYNSFMSARMLAWQSKKIVIQHTIVCYNLIFNETTKRGKK